MAKFKKTKFVDAETAVKAIESYDRVVLGNFCAEPIYLPDKLMERAEELEGVKIFHCTPFGRFQEKYLMPGMEKHIRCVTPFCGRKEAPRKMIKVGKADFVSVSLGKVPNFLTGPFNANVFMTMVSPPDENGYLNLGVSVDFARALIEKPVKKIIVEINPRMPRTHGDSLLHISKVDYAVEIDLPLFEFQQKEITDIDIAIGKNTAKIVEDGATLQIGFGSVSESIISFLKEKNDLGIHSEMIPDGIIELVEMGVVNGNKKSINKGKIICTFIGGTKKIYDWVNDNEMISMQRVEYVNNPIVASKNHKLTAINSALQVDLFGNIYSDIFGLDNQYTGSGGQLDFVLGCNLSEDSKFIIAMPSCALKGTVSKIVAHPSLEKNNNIPVIPTVPRYCADYIVTEYGVAALKYRSNKERANELIKIAHPVFQDDLIKKAKTIGLL